MPGIGADGASTGAVELLGSASVTGAAAGSEATARLPGWTASAGGEAAAAAAAGVHAGAAAGVLAGVGAAAAVLASMLAGAAAGPDGSRGDFLASVSDADSVAGDDAGGGGAGVATCAVAEGARRGVRRLAP